MHPSERRPGRAFKRAYQRINKTWHSCLCMSADYSFFEAGIETSTQVPVTPSSGKLTQYKNLIMNPHLCCPSENHSHPFSDGLSRRKFIKLAGGTLSVVALSGLSWRARAGGGAG